MILILLMLYNARLLEAVDSSLFLQEMVPVSNLVVFEEPDYVESALVCSFMCLEKNEKCFLVCIPGYVPEFFRGLYCNHKSANAEWDKPLDGFKCLPTTLVVTGGWQFPTYNEVYTIGLFSITKSILLDVDGEEVFVVAGGDTVLASSKINCFAT
ncbi:uncharacterized protein LOC111713283 [Eurytemora carolleeae]|uniref:uncharacterized protein LOC111713283 n=1 Tax=Eurytemora carolleeae TaxID=1294199 RepID=UPI000C77E200|nr:uncharacterized protein LOC111713283 [Eurytemora carolleeae]|eukprot:XP_023343886.1 uncharacterized protein LOC111713283 [Eurytemora affinis]